MHRKSNTFTLSAYVIGLFFVFAISSCKKDCLDPTNPDCSNYDACLTEVRTSAEFGFFTKGSVIAGGERVEVYLPMRDTIPIVEGGGMAVVYFRAKSSEMDHYEWKVGHDPRTFTDSLFHLLFQDVSGNVEIILNVENETPNINCFPEDNGTDEVNQALHFLPYNASTEEGILAVQPIFGEYLGANEESPKDTFRVQVNRTHWAAEAPHIVGLFEEFTVWRLTFNPYNMYFAENRSEFYLEGMINLQPDNQEIVIDYTLRYHNENRIDRKRWRGKKL